MFITLLVIGQALSAMDMSENRQFLNIVSAKVLSCTSFLAVLRSVSHLQNFSMTLLL